MSHVQASPANMTLAKARGLAKAVARVLIVGFLIIMLLEAFKATTWLIRLQSDRLEGTTTASPLEDYLAYYAAGRLVVEGRGDEIYDRDPITEVQREAMGREVGGTGVLPYFNPPFVAAAVAPITKLDVATFTTILFVFVSALILATGIVLSKLAGFQCKQEKLVFWLAYLSFPAMTWLIGEMQLSIVVILGWSGFVLCQITHRPTLSGLALALVLVKPQMGILAVAFLLFRREWRTLSVFAGVGLIAALVSVVVSGPEILLRYPTFLLESTTWEGSGVHADQMFGWNGVAATLTHDATPPMLVVLALILPTLLLVGLVARFDAPAESPQYLLQLSAIILGTQLINPHLYRQDLVLLIPAVVLLAVYGSRQGHGASIAIFLAVTTWSLGKWGPELLMEHSLPVVPLVMMAILCGVVLEARKYMNPGARGTITASPPRHHGTASRYSLSR